MMKWTVLIAKGSAYLQRALMQCLMLTEVLTEHQCSVNTASPLSQQWSALRLNRSVPSEAHLDLCGRCLWTDRSPPKAPLAGTTVDNLVNEVNGACVNKRKANEEMNGADQALVPGRHQEQNCV